MSGINVPLPELVQVPEVDPPLTTALMAASGLFAQVNNAGPASTNGAGVIVIITFCETGVQAFVAVKVSVTVPAAVSALLGIYVALNVVLFGVNVPLPLLVQMPLPVLDVADKSTVALFAHTV